MLAAANLRKQYTTVLAVDNVSLNVTRGAVVGVLGPNGAGKTTAIRMLLNIIQPDAGSVSIDGKPFDDGVRNLVGYLPEERGLYRKSKLLNTILYFASLKQIPAAEAKKRAYTWLERFNLLNYHDRKVEELSKGNQQKVQFIISVLHDPQLLILDEPFSGLDPLNQVLLKDILLEQKQMGKAIIFSTHQMDQAERLCDSMYLINAGKVVLDGSLREVKDKFGKNAVQLEFEGDGSFLTTLPAVLRAQRYQNYAEILLKPDISPYDFLRAVSQKLNIRKFEIVQPSLNSIFLEVVGNKEQSAVKGQQS
jgi:ABC-2 type transport system ATP-binding protein